MKILFVRSGNQGIDPISTRQGLSLKNKEVDVVFFDILGKGIKGYTVNYFKLKKAAKQHHPDLVHAHYSFSGLISLLACSGLPVGVSLMGSDVLRSSKTFKRLIQFFSRHWSFVIVKSHEMQVASGIGKAIVLPNGVDFDLFGPADKEQAQYELGWDRHKKHILFGADPQIAVKNFKLAENALNRLKNRSDVEVHFLADIPFEKVPCYYNAADLLLLTSLSEGSPNVIKEAMACNCPIVATNVGDIRDVVKETQGCFLTGFDAEDVAEKIRLALAFKGRTNGREKIGHLDNRIVVQKIINVYKTVLNEISGVSESNLE
jgi:glycosyltransferase involved in cell wall biosynthesis